MKHTVIRVSRQKLLASENRLKLNDENVDVIDQTELLGSILTDDLKCDKNWHN